MNNNDRAIIFDIETGPESPSILSTMMPAFEPPANYKDPAKIAAWEDEKRSQWVRDAALSPMTGRILAIGYVTGQDGDSKVMIECDENEAAMIQHFWDYLDATRTMMAPQLVGFNSNSFDLPYLIKRSWKHGIKVPQLRKGNYWDTFVALDIRDIWQLGDRQAVGSLDTVSRFMGLPGKSGSGADFATMLQKDRDAALAYLRNDVLLTKALWQLLIAL
jgi:predicted PolB exonuclease-like 3'-5' exonuclease